VHWVGACANDHALISRTIDVQLLSYQDPERETQEAEQEQSRRKKLIPSKHRAFNQNSTQSCAQLPNKSSLILTRESVSKRWVSGHGVIECRVATAEMLMHKNPSGTDNWARERGPHRSQEQVEILKEIARLKAARTTHGRPGQASVAV